MALALTPLDRVELIRGVMVERLFVILIDQVELQVIFWLNGSWVDVKPSEMLSPIFEPFRISVDEVLLFKDAVGGVREGN